MSITDHDGDKIPVLTGRWDPSKIEWVDFSFPESRALSSITYVLPSGWTEVDTRSAVTVTDDSGVEYANTYSVKLSTSEIYGDYIITARAVFDDGCGDDRSVRISISDT